MLTFIQANGVYISFWLGLYGPSFLGLYWAIRLAIRHERRREAQMR